MKILIDGRFYGLENAGIGRYVINLIQNLKEIDRENEYFLLLRTKYFKELELPSNWKKIKADFRHYTLIEQFKIPQLIKQINPDICHFPHFNVPLFYRGKFIVTIHDLIKHNWKGSKTTTHQQLFYWLKYLGYLVIFNKAVKSSSKIIVPSNEVKKELKNKFGLKDDKIFPIYEGVEEKWFNDKIRNKTILEKYNINNPFLIYTGSVYPHKNVERLIQSIKLLNEERQVKNQSKILLLISSSRNVFLEKVEQRINELKLKDFVKTIGFAPDEDLMDLYKFAEAFVFPSLSEGFGLTALEAMAGGCPVVCSDIPIFKEIYDNAVLFFDPENIEDIKSKIISLIDDKTLKIELSKKGIILAKKYSWRVLATETLSIYSKTAKQ